MSGGMIILGVDTSLRSTGYGVLEVSGSRMRALDYGNIRNAPALPVSECLLKINSVISGLIAAWQPEVTAAYMARAATAVLPQPTSPCTSRFIGMLFFISVMHSSITLCCAPVRLKGRPDINSLEQSFFTV